MVLLYAAATDVQTWTGNPNPANISTLIRSASLLVREATRNCWYAADPTTNLPTDAATLQAFNDATCAQCSFWIANGIDPQAVLKPQTVLNSKAIGSARLGYDTAGAGSVQAYTEWVTAAKTLCDEAWRILSDANLQLNGVWVVG